MASKSSPGLWRTLLAPAVVATYFAACGSGAATGGAAADAQAVGHDAPTDAAVDAATDAAPPSDAEQVAEIAAAASDAADADGGQGIQDIDDIKDIALQDIAGSDDATDTADAKPALADTAPIDTAPIDTAPIDTAPIDTAPTPLQLSVTGPKVLKGNLYLLTFTPAQMLQAGGPPPEAAQVVAKIAVTAWPWQGSVELPKGTWVLAALLAPGDFDPASGLAVGFGCVGGKSIAVTYDGSTSIPTTLDLTLVPMDQMQPIAEQCGAGLVGAPATSLLNPTFAVTPPSSQAGGAHLLGGIWKMGTFWVAGHQDGFVTFSIDGVSTPQGQADWQTHPKGLCSRLAAVGDWVACSTRRPMLALAKADLTTGKPTEYANISLPSDQLADGMAVRGDRLLLAAHAAGLASRSALPPFGALPLAVAATLSDAWDVQPLGANHLAVADGAGGLVLAAVDSTWHVTPAGTLALPGLTSVLAVVGDQVVVGSASGRVSLVDASVPTKPLLQWSLATPWPVYGVSAAQNLILAAGGPALWAFDQTAPGQVLVQPTVRDAELSYYYAMDIDPVGFMLVTSEFAAVRTLSIDTTAPVGPQPMLAKAIYSKPVALGDPIAMQLRVWSVGNQPVQITKISWIEDASQVGAGTQLMGSQKVAPFTSEVIALQATKTLKGITKHLLKVQFDPPGEQVVVVKETTLLHPGEALPPLQYLDATGKALNVNAYLAGKPGVVVVAAHACPVAFQALAAVAHDLAGVVASDAARVVAIDPWDKPTNIPETAALKTNFPVLFAPLSTADNHEYSALLQDILPQPTDNAAPMPLVYVVGPDGKIVDCRQGYEPKTVAMALASLGAPP